MKKILIILGMIALLLAPVSGNAFADDGDCGGFGEKNGLLGGN